MAYVPYTGANDNVDLGNYNLNAKAIGIGTSISSFALDVNGNVNFDGNLALSGTLAAAIGAGGANNFVVSNAGLLEYRTAAQVLTDIGAAPAVTGGYVPYTGAIANVDLGSYDLTANNGIFNGDFSAVGNNIIFGNDTAELHVDIIAPGGSDGLRLYSFNNTHGTGVSPPNIGFYRLISPPTPTSLARFVIKGNTPNDSDVTGFSFYSPESSLYWISGSIEAAYVGIGLPSEVPAMNFAQYSYFTAGLVVVGGDVGAASPPVGGMIRSGRKNFDLPIDINGSDFTIAAGGGNGGATGGGNIFFQTPDVQPVDSGLVQPLTTKMVLSRDGSVGIGITTPAFKLDVAGNANFDNEIIVGGTITGSISAGSANNFVVSNAGLLEYRTAAQVLSDIGAQAALSGTGFVKISGTTISYDNTTYYTSGDSPSFGNITASIFIGVATSTFSQISGSTVGTISLGGTSSTLSGGVVYQVNGTPKAYHYLDTNNGLIHQTVTGIGQIFYSDGAEAMRLAVTNKALLVGYTSDPTSGNKLAVNGNAYFNGSITANTTSVMAGIVQTGVFRQNIANSIAGNTAMDVVNVSSAGYGLFVQGGSTNATPTNYNLFVRDYAGGTAFSVYGGNGAFGGTLSANLPAYTSGTSLPVVYNSTNNRFETSTSGSLTNPMTTLGDIIYGGTSGVPTRLSIGSNGYMLGISSGLPSWRTPSQILSDIGAQAALSGTGFVKISGTTISYDNTTYYTSGDSPSFGNITASIFIGVATSTFSQISGSTVGTISLGGTSTNVSGGLAYQVNGTVKAYHYVNNSFLQHETVTGVGQVFYSDGAEAMRLAVTNKALLVGYTSDPTSDNKLAVNGNAYFAGSITANAGSYTGSALTAINTNSNGSGAFIQGGTSLSTSTISQYNLKLSSYNNDHIASFYTDGIILNACTSIGINSWPSVDYALYVGPSLADPNLSLCVEAQADFRGVVSIYEYLRIGNVPTYANNVAAIAGGLSTGFVYKTSSGVLMIVY